MATKTTGPKAASAAAKVLSSSNTGKASKTAGGKRVDAGTQPEGVDLPHGCIRCIEGVA